MRVLMASLVAFCGFALPAMAQQDVPEMPAPTLSETDEAQPDWFQSFNFSTDIQPCLDQRGPLEP